MKQLGKVNETERGFEIVRFRDRYGVACSLQQSSLATEPALWLGPDDADPKVLASQAGSLGVDTNETTGWVPYPIPDEVDFITRMHLTRRQVKGLVNHLTRWLETDSFKF